MAGKYEAKVKSVVDKFWIENKFPPTLRDIMGMTGIPSTSVCRYVVRNINGIRIARNGRVIPLWVDNLFKNNLVVDQKGK